MVTETLEQFEAKEQELKTQLEEEEKLWEENENRETAWDDRHQGVLFLPYGDPLLLNQFYAELKQRRIGFRVIAGLIDITFPCYPNKVCNDQRNWFKHFVTNQNKDFLEMLNKNIMVKKMIENLLSKKNYKIMNVKKLNWEHDNCNVYLPLGLTPLAWQYQESYKNLLKDETHKKNYESLGDFESTGYVKLTDGLFGNDRDKIKYEYPTEKTII